MDHFVFVLWVIGYPVSAALCEFLAVKSRGRRFEDFERGIAAFINFAIWSGFGWALW